MSWPSRTMFESRRISWRIASLMASAMLSSRSGMSSGCLVASRRGSGFYVLDCDSTLWTAALHLLQVYPQFSRELARRWDCANDRILLAWRLLHRDRAHMNVCDTARAAGTLWCVVVNWFIRRIRQNAQ